MPTDPLPKGIRRTPSGTWQVYVRVRGVYRSRTYPAETQLRVLIEHREHLRAEEKYGIDPPAEWDVTFRADATAYLALCAGMPTYSDRAYRIGRWVGVFGARDRATITAREIREQLERWRVRGRHDGGPLANASLNQLRTALMAMYTVLDGKSAANIVKDVPAYDERDSVQVRAESLLTCLRLIRRLKPGGKMRAVLYALLWTGWPHALFAELTASDVDWDGQRVRVGRRRKGKGMEAAWIPVVPQAIRALRLVHRRDAWGGCSTSSLHSAMARAVETENTWRQGVNAKAKREVWPLVRESFNPYGLRHSFGTWAAARVKDDRALKELLRTNSIARYTEGAVDARLTAARDLLVQARAMRPGRRVLPFAAKA